MGKIPMGKVRIEGLGRVRWDDLVDLFRIYVEETRFLDVEPSLGYEAIGEGGYFPGPIIARRGDLWLCAAGYPEEDMETGEKVYSEYMISRVL